MGTRSETVNHFWGKNETVVTEITVLEPPTLLSRKQVNKVTFGTDGSHRFGARGRRST